MFFKNSRYYKLGNTAKLDANGVVVETKQMRILPMVSGQFQHIIEDTDRLDSVAYKYYKKPGQWWHLCDANTEFMSPRALLGKEPVRQTNFEVQWDGLQAPWHHLRNALMLEVGVESVLFGSEQRAYPDEVVFDLSFLFSMDISLQPDIHESILLQQLGSNLDTQFQAHGHVLDSNIKITQLENNHWQLTELSTRVIFNIRSEEGVLNVYSNAIRFNWLVSVVHNEININADQLKAKIETIDAGGFSAFSPINICRVGKPIIIPPLLAGAGN